MAAHTAKTSVSAAPEPLGEGPAEARITRLFARFISSGYLFYLALMAPSIAGEAAVLASWWTVSAVTAVYGPPIVLGVVSFHRDLRWTRRAAAASALGFIIAALTWPLAWNGELLRADAWISTIPGLAGLAAAVVWRPAWTLAALICAVVPVQLINHFCRAPGHNGVLVPDLMFAMSFCLLYVCAALMAMRTGRLLDATRAEAHEAAAAAAAASARTVQRARFNALLHDWAMSTLLAAARGTHRAEVRHQAELALAKLDDVEAEGSGAYTADAVAAHLRTAVADVDERLAVSCGESPSGAAFPAEPVHVLGAAVSEAVRNSVLHAGASAARTVVLSLADSRIDIVVADDGAGFDTTRIASHRLGLAVSIVERVRGLPGGAVDVTSRPGAGTTIHMSWQAVTA
ncbi:putative two-component system sensor kinase [Nocardia nova SH22a]|uniref:Putative two-component system sensor kinase n=1 Tax=Nocardia nova SH22a TaxID=1415166 RepID=W5TSL2_9NOCA|nr:ATP-binding protein [Nocardia nova]AHH20211.1 putative two-component system sensor kinase [Nocardia nova SH22a]